MRQWTPLALLLVSLPALTAQSPTPSWRPGAELWAPLPTPATDKLPDPTGKDEIIARLTISGFAIRFESTPLDSVRNHFNAEIGAAGDAGEAERWVCVQGQDDNGPWVLWLLSNAIDGPAVGGFEWLRIDTADKVDRRCKHLAPGQDVIQLPVPLRLDMSLADAAVVLGTPSGLTGRSRIYVHAHTLTSNGESYSAENTVYLQFRQKSLRAIHALYTISK
ncbi:MAG TPA: hypothetical protein VGL22_00375 [Terracidiphilus sp.]